MEQSQMTKQMIHFQKAFFNNSFNTMTLLQNQTENMSRTLLNQSKWLPDEGRAAMERWIDACKKGRQDFKRTVEESFARAEAMFASE
jgi:hypothetical protein